MKSKSLIASTIVCTLLCAPVWVNAAEQSGSQMQTQRSLMNMQASEIQGKTVVNMQGDKLGKVDKLVQDRKDNSIQAVISVGGFLGIGAKEITIPVVQLQLQQDKLAWNRSLTKDQLKQRPAYQQAQYRVINKDETLAQASNQATGGQQTLSFQSLDTNHDGYISPDEAKADPQLADNFRQADQNADVQIDQSEFSAFEEAQPHMSPGEGGTMRQQQPGSGGTMNQ